METHNRIWETGIWTANILLQANGETGGNGESVLGVTLILMLIGVSIALVALTVVALVWAWAFGYYFKTKEIAADFQKLRIAFEKIANKP